MTDSNLRNESGLDYILALISGPVFGFDMYPSKVDKAAALGWYIITRHPFYDTNKRTGMEATFEFLELNGLVPAPQITTSDVIATALAVENGTLDYQQLSEWILVNFVEP